MKRYISIALSLAFLAVSLLGFAPPVQASSKASPAPQATPPPSSNAPAYISSITLAKDVQGPENSPVNPAAVFAATDTFHAVVAIQNAPANTTYKSSWFAVNVGSAAPPNTLIDSATVTAEGSANIDFSLTPPKTNWPVGTYSVEIDVNGIKAAELLFAVQ